MTSFCNRRRTSPVPCLPTLLGDADGALEAQSVHLRSAQFAAIRTEHQGARPAEVELEAAGDGRFLTLGRIQGPLRISQAGRGNVPHPRLRQLGSWAAGQLGKPDAVLEFPSGICILLPLPVPL